MTKESKIHLNNLQTLINAAVQKGGFFKSAEDVVNMNKSFEYVAGKTEVADLVEEQKNKLNGSEKPNKSTAGVTE